ETSARTGERPDPSGGGDFGPRRPRLPDRDGGGEREGAPPDRLPDLRAEPRGALHVERPLPSPPPLGAGSPTPAAARSHHDLFPDRRDLHPFRPDRPPRSLALGTPRGGLGFRPRRDGDEVPLAGRADLVLHGPLLPARVGRRGGDTGATTGVAVRRLLLADAGRRRLQHRGGHLRARSPDDPAWRLRGARTLAPLRAGRQRLPRLDGRALPRASGV
ncbi:MAG: FIG01964566: Predicted membrane protein, hemolysin III homolog, partial [uncultured Thermomicrobiales bacterium]